MEPQVQNSIGGILGALGGVLVTWLLIRLGVIVDVLGTCDSYPNPNLQMVEQEGFGRYCGYTWGAIVAAGFIPISLCSLLGVAVAQKIQEKL